MPQATIGIGDCGVVSDPDCTLVTYGLGSCIAVAAWDPQTRVAGMLHCMFPESSADPVRLRENPFLFADSGVPAMLQRLTDRGAIPGRLILRAAGGASVLQGPSFFEVGRKNLDSMRRALARAGLVLHDEELGGTVSRTLRLDVASGRCWVEQNGRILELRGRAAEPRR